jgi:hypothetical protein
VLSEALKLWLWTLEFLQKAKDADGKTSIIPSALA